MDYIYKGLLFTLALSVTLACSYENNQMQSASEPTLVEVDAIYDAENDQHLFQTETDTIPAGWTTFKFTNKSPMVHFLFFDYLPEGKTSEDLLEEVSPIFQESSYLLMEGKNEEAMAIFSKLPDWFGEIVFRGGAGFVSPGNSTNTTLFMKPGNYVMECYIKTADGTFHWKKGMTKDLFVTADTTEAEEPSSSTIHITTTDAGLEVEGDITPGKHLVKVSFEEENPGMVARDVHVAKLDENDSTDEIVKWFDFNTANGLVSTAEDPAPTTLIGGTHEMPKGNTAYFTVEFEEGRYAWITEQPASNSFIREFTVSSEQN